VRTGSTPHHPRFISADTLDAAHTSARLRLGPNVSVSAVKAERMENIHMHLKRYEFSWRGICAWVVAVALVLGVLIFGGYAAAVPKPGGAPPAAPSKDKDQVFTQIYLHTYDEVFQASLEAIERMGLFVTAQDKDKGTISGKGSHQQKGVQLPRDWTFDIHIETLSTKPETRVTINASSRGWVLASEKAAFKQDMASELQKVLSTYH
jgi:hypothetical protein